MKIKIKPWWVLITLGLILSTKLILGGIARAEPQGEAFLGFHTIHGEGVSLTLPDRYWGGNPQRDLLKIQSELEQFLVTHTDFASYLEQNADDIALVAIDTANDSPNPVGINIIEEMVPSNQTFEDYVQVNRDRLGKVYQVTGDQTVVINGLASHQLSLQTEIEGVNLQQLIYLIPQGQNLWIVTLSHGQQSGVQGTELSTNDTITTMETAIQTITITFAGVRD